MKSLTSFIQMILQAKLLFATLRLQRCLDLNFCRVASIVFLDTAALSINLCTH